MTTMPTRRSLLAAAPLAAAIPLIRPLAAHAGSAAPIPLAVTRRTLEVNGRAASVFGLHQSDGTPGVTLAPGERFVVDLANRAGEPTIVHWHGQTPPVRQDGVAITGLESLIQPGTSQGYDFVPRPGTHWMHSHHGLQEQQLLAAPVVVRTAEDLRADAQEVVVMLHDFTFRDPREILAQLLKGTDEQDAPAVAHGHAMAGMAMTPGKTVMDLNDIDFDAYLANDRTLADPLVVRVERGGRVRLRLINGATSTAFWLDLGALDGTVVAVDGDPVHPVSVRHFPMTEAQRVDVVVRIPSGGGAFPILAQREGGRARTGIILATPGAPVAKISAAANEKAGPVDLSLERHLRARTPLAPRRADVVHLVALTGSMHPYRWSINGRTWANHEPLGATTGQRVELDIVNHTGMAHPMHLHGHHFQVLALNGQALSGAMRDTILVPVKGRVRAAFDADNTGRWLFHCHNLYHMASGMMTEVAYSDFT